MMSINQLAAKMARSRSSSGLLLRPR